MDLGVYIVIFLNFLLIGALPFIFFKRDGKMNAQWWLTATPFLLSIGSVTANCLGALPQSICFHTFPDEAILATVFSVSSIALISFTLGTHRIPISLWHQNNDAPREIVTWGAYQYIRHPFYASFITAFVAALIYSPQIFTAAACVLGLAILNWTAAKEERKLLSSTLGAEYKAYMLATGRFLPRLKGEQHA